VCELGIEMNQQVVVVEVLDRIFRVCAHREGRDMVKLCGCVQCYSPLGVLLWAGEVFQELTKHVGCQDGRGKCVQDATDDAG
jgi:hypothetical protein